MTSVCPSGDSRRSPQGSFPLGPRMRSLPAARLMACPMGVAEYRFVDLNTVFVDSTELSLCLKAALRPAKIGAARARDARAMHERGQDRAHTRTICGPLSVSEHAGGIRANCDGTNRASVRIFGRRACSR